jgi:LPS sulfotransferase NodH
LFGCKLHWGQMTQVRAEFDPELDHETDATIPVELIEELFPPPVRFVRIVRLDRDRQAVSYWRARSSNVWSVGIGSPSPAPDPPPYDFGAIEGCRTEIGIGESCWDRYLNQAGVEPLRVTYEELESRYQQAIERVAAHIAPREPARARPPATRRLRDRQSIELLERYRQERRRAAANSAAEPL